MYVIIYIIKITALSGEDFYLFSIGFSELILILIIAYVFVGPQDLPKVARWFGRIVKRARALISEVKKESGWEQLVNETEDVRKELKENKSLATLIYKELYIYATKSFSKPSLIPGRY